MQKTSTPESVVSSSPKVGFVSLGCPKALVDSERVLTQLRTEGYLVTPDYQNADVVVVNTCGSSSTAPKQNLWKPLARLSLKTVKSF